MIEDFKIQGTTRCVYLFTQGGRIMLCRMRTQRQAAQCGKELDVAVKAAIEAVLARYPEVTR